MDGLEQRQQHHRRQPRAEHGGGDAQQEPAHELAPCRAGADQAVDHPRRRRHRHDQAALRLTAEEGEAEPEAQQRRVARRPPLAQSVGREQQPRQHHVRVGVRVQEPDHQIRGEAVRHAAEQRGPAAQRERSRQQVGAQRREHELEHVDPGARPVVREHDADPGEREQRRALLIGEQRQARRRRRRPDRQAPLAQRPPDDQAVGLEDEAGVRLEHVGGRQRLRRRGVRRLLEHDAAGRDDLAAERRRCEQHDREHQGHQQRECHRLAQGRDTLPGVACGAARGNRGLAAVDFRVLGPVQVVAGSGPVELASGQADRAPLAAC